MTTSLTKSDERTALILMSALTFSTGVFDAIGYLGLDKVFTGNMTGNVVILFMGFGGATGIPVVGPLAALFTFMLGAVVAGRTLRNRVAGWNHHSTGLLVGAGVLLAMVGSALAVQPSLAQAPTNVVLTSLLAFGMGAQAGVARHIGVRDINTVVVTSTIVGLAYDSVLGARLGQTWHRRAFSILLIGLGATTGTLLLRVGIHYGVLLAACVLISVALIGHRLLLSKRSK
jgi:uncharacterized membrane protein YoaK (UPF0700 family)